jgi:hypothetical protein
MPDKPSSHTGYTYDQTELSERVLLDVWSRLGDYREHLVLVGGLAPRYIVGQRAVPHCGTMDVDLGISVAVADLNAYASIRETLVDRMGFSPGLNPAGREQRHSFGKEINGIEVNIDFLTTKYDGPDDSLMREVEQELSAIQVEGLGLAFDDPLVVPIRGELLEGGMTTENVQVCRPIPFVILKALAYENRREPKDVYDLVYVLQFAIESTEDGDVGGPRRLAERLRKEEASQASFLHAIASMQRHFSSPMENGPTKYGAFLENPGDGIQAYAAVQEFLRSLPYIGIGDQSGETE